MHARFRRFASALLSTLLGILWILLLLSHPDLAAEGIRRGLSLCADTLIPSLFPFLVLSEFLIASGAGDWLCKAFSHPVRALFGVSDSAASAILLGALCGFPVGTVTVLSLRRERKITDDELKRLVLFVNIPSPGFLIGAVGAGLFHTPAVGVALYLFSLSSACIFGILLRLFYGKANVVSHENPQNGIGNTPFSVIFTGAVKRAFAALLQVIAFVLFFACLAELLSPTFEKLPAFGAVFFCGLLELTSGVSAAVRLLSPVDAFRSCAFFAGFSGLSVCFQIFSVAEEKKPRVLPYLAAKLTQGVLSLFFAEIYLRVFHPVLLTAAPALAVRPSAPADFFLPPLLFLAELCFVVLALLLFACRKIKKERRRHS